MEVLRFFYFLASYSLLVLPLFVHLWARTKFGKEVSSTDSNCVRWMNRHWCNSIFINNKGISQGLKFALLDRIITSRHKVCDKNNLSQTAWMPVLCYIYLRILHSWLIAFKIIQKERLRMNRVNRGLWLARGRTREREREGGEEGKRNKLVVLHFETIRKKWIISVALVCSKTVKYLIWNTPSFEATSKTECLLWAIV